MSDRSGDILLIAGFVMAAWGWLRARAGRTTLRSGGVPLAGASAYDPKTEITGSVSLPGYLDDPFKPAVPAAPFTSDLASSFFAPAATPSAQAAPRVGSFGWKSLAEFKGQATELDVFARTLFGEASNQGRAGIEAVAAVIINRVNSRRHPNTVRSVCLLRSQFEVWNEEAPNAVRSYSETTQTSSVLRLCFDIAQKALDGRLVDPTGGATLYYSPPAMRPPYSKPSWNFDVLRLSKQIGDHLFYVEL